MLLRNPRGRIVRIHEPLASYYASRSGWTVLDNAPEPTQEQRKSTDFSTREATAIAKAMTADELAEFVQGDERKTIQKLL